MSTRMEILAALRSGELAWSGRPSAVARQIKRLEAEERNAKTPPERRKKARTSHTTKTATISIDGVRALRLLREVVAEHGADTIYQRPEPDSCFYQHGGKCSCGVGHALFRAGLTVEQLAEMDVAKPDAGSGIDIVPLPDGVAMDGWAREIFRAFQLKQDFGHTWGDALAAARSKAGQLGVTA